MPANFKLWRFIPFGSLVPEHCQPLLRQPRRHQYRRRRSRIHNDARCGFFRRYAASGLWRKQRCLPYFHAVPRRSRRNPRLSDGIAARRTCARRHRLDQSARHRDAPQRQYGKPRRCRSIRQQYALHVHQAANRAYFRRGGRNRSRVRVGHCRPAKQSRRKTSAPALGRTERPRPARHQPDRQRQPLGNRKTHCRQLIVCLRGKQLRLNYRMK